MHKTPQPILDTLTDLILETPQSKPILVAINGRDASGKTILSKNLVAHLKVKTDRPVIYIAFDNFLNKASIRNAQFESEGKGSYEHAFNYKGFVDSFLKPLTTSRVYKSKIYDLATDSEIRPEFEASRPNAIFVVDGLFLYRKELVDYWDIKILIEADTNEIIERGSERDKEVFGGYELAQQRFVNRYMPSQEIYYSEVHPEKIADIIIENSKPNNAYTIQN